MNKIQNEQVVLDIIIINYNSTAALAGCLQSLESQITGVPVKIMVFDNNSHDHPALISRLFPEVTLIRNPVNIGFAAAVNRCIERTRSPFVMLLNPDTRIIGNPLNAVINLFRNDPKTAAVGPGILNGDGTVQGSARAFPTPFTGLFGRTSLLTQIFPHNRLSRKNILAEAGMSEVPVRVDWVSGACMVVRRRAIEDIGLLDERFFMYWEDADWCRRMQTHGWQVVYFPGASIVHTVGESSGKRKLKSLLDFHWSAYLLFAKYVRRPYTLFKPFAFWVLSMSFFLKWAGLVFEKNRKVSK